MKRISSIFSMILIVLLLVSCGSKNDHKKVFDSLEINYAAGDSKSSVTKDFKLPIISSVNENAIIVWTSQNSKVVKIENQTNAIVTQSKSQETVSLDVLITIKGKEKSYIYTVVVKAKEDVVYTITYDSNGGTSVPKTEVKESHIPIKPANPTKEGYVFVEWRLNGVKYEFNNVLTSSLHLVAHWTLPPADQANYKVVHKIENLLDDEFTVYDTQELSETVGSSVSAQALSIEGFTLKEGQDLSGTVLEDGSLEIVVYYERNVYQVKFDGISQNVKHGGQAVVPTVTPDEGFEFFGWLPVVPNEITENMEFVSDVRKTGADYKVVHKIENLLDDEFTVYDTQELRGSIDDIVTAQALSIEGFTLKEGQDLSGTVLEDGSLEIVVYYERNVYQVKFDGISQNVKHGGEAVLPENPTKVGYTFTGWDPLVPKTITQAIEFTATFDAALVSYKVIHHQQKLSLTEYQISATDNLQALSDTIVTAVGKIYNGYHLVEDQEFEFVVLADGSLEINLYYNRNSYTVTFDGVAQQVLFGGEAIIPTVDVEVGYKFIGWDPLVPATITHNIDFVSNIQPENVSYKINHYGQNIVDNEYTLLETSNAEGLTDSFVLAEAVVFNSHILISDLSAEYKVLGDGSLDIDLYYDRNVYEVSFSDDVSSQSVRHGGLATKPNDPVKEGYNFVAWLNNGVAYDFSKPVTSPLTLVAQFNAGNVSYSVIHMLETFNDDEYVLEEKQTFFGTTNETVTAASKSFTGFEVLEGQDLSGTVLADGSLEITIKYKRNIYTVLIEGAPNLVKHGGYVDLPAEEPYREGFVFVGYLVLYEVEEILITDPVTKNLNFTVVYKDITPPVLVVNNTKIYLERLIQNYDLLALLDVEATDNDGDANVTLDLKNFDITVAGTYLIDVIATDKTGNTTTLPATIVVESIVYTVIFNYNDEESTVIPLLGIENEVLEYIPIPSRQNYRFVRWEIHGTNETFDENTIITKELLVNAIWETAFTFKITFDSNGGSSVSSQYITENDKAHKPADPQRINYQFNLWYLGTEPYNFDTPITSNITLVASWSKTSEIEKVELDNLVTFYQQTEEHQIYITDNNKLFFTKNDVKLDITSYLKLEPGETIKYMISSLAVYLQNDKINILVVTSLNNVKCVTVDATTHSYVGSKNVEVPQMNNVHVLYRYDLLSNQNNFIIYGDNAIYLYTGGDVVEITSDFDLAADEYFVVDPVTIDDPYDFVVKTNKRYFIPVTEAMFYFINTGDNVYYYDITDYLIAKLPGSELIYVRAGIEGMSAYDEYLNKVMVEFGSTEAIITNKASNVILNDGETIVESQAPFFVTSLNRVFYVNEITKDFEIIEIDMQLEENEEIELIVVNLQMTLIKTSNNRFFSLLSSVAKPQAVDVSQTILSYIENGNIDVAYKSSEVFVVIGNGIVLTIA